MIILLLVQFLLFFYRTLETEQLIKSERRERGREREKTCLGLWSGSKKILYQLAVLCDDYMLL